MALSDTQDPLGGLTPRKETRAAPAGPYYTWGNQGPVSYDSRGIPYRIGVDGKPLYYLDYNITPKPNLNFFQEADWDPRTGTWDKNIAWTERVLPVAMLGAVGGGIGAAALGGSGAAGGGIASTGGVGSGITPALGGSGLAGAGTGAIGSGASAGLFGGAVPAVGAGGATAGGTSAALGGSLGGGAGVASGGGGLLSLLGKGKGFSDLGSVISGAAKGSAEQRYQESDALLRQLLLAQSGARDQFSSELDSAKFQREGQDRERKQAILMQLLNNTQDQSITPGNPAIAARMPQVVGGARPSNLTTNRESLLALLQQPQIQAPTYQPPPQMQIPQQGKGEQILGGLGLGASILGALGSLRR